MRRRSTTAGGKCHICWAYACECGKKEKEKLLYVVEMRDGTEPASPLLGTDTFTERASAYHHADALMRSVGGRWVNHPTTTGNRYRSYTEQKLIDVYSKVVLPGEE